MTLWPNKLGRGVCMSVYVYVCVCMCVSRPLAGRPTSQAVSVQLKTVITVIFAMAGDEAAHPGCDMPVTGVHA